MGSMWIDGDGWMDDSRVEVFTVCTVMWLLLINALYISLSKMPAWSVKRTEHVLRGRKYKGHNVAAWSPAAVYIARVAVQVMIRGQRMSTAGLSADARAIPWDKVLL